KARRPGQGRLWPGRWAPRARLEPAPGWVRPERPSSLSSAAPAAGRAAFLVGLECAEALLGLLEVGHHRLLGRARAAPLHGVVNRAVGGEHGLEGLASQPAAGGRADALLADQAADPFEDQPQ